MKGRYTMEDYEYDFKLDEEELVDAIPLSEEQKAQRDEWLTEAASALKEING